MKPTQTSIYAVYLLHFDEPVGKARHYLGMCKAARLHWRQLEHLRGVGASLTARAARQNIGWTVAATWWTADVHLEREIKNASHFEKLCPVCIAGHNCCIAPVGLAHYAPKPMDKSFAALNGETHPNKGRYPK